MVRRVVIAGVLLAAGPAARAAQHLTCAQIVAVHRFAGGKMTADQLAKNLHTDVETVRNCLENKAEPAKPSPATTPAPK